MAASYAGNERVVQGGDYGVTSQHSTKVVPRYFQWVKHSGELSFTGNCSGYRSYKDTKSYKEHPTHEASGRRGQVN